VGTFDNEVLGVDVTKGEVLWRYQHPKRHFPFYSSAALSQGRVLIGGRDKMLHALDQVTGEAAWTFVARSRIDASPVVAGPNVYFADTSGILYGLDVKSGEVRWKFETGEGIVASPSVASGRLVIGSVDGTLYCFGEKKKDANSR
jgi:outer membrane protein assembly factor BamB